MEPIKIAVGIKRVVGFAEGEFSVATHDHKFLMGYDRLKLHVEATGDRSITVMARNGVVVGEKLSLRVSDGMTVRDFEFLVVG